MDLYHTRFFFLKKEFFSFYMLAASKKLSKAGPPRHNYLPFQHNTLEQAARISTNYSDILNNIIFEQESWTSLVQN